MSFFSQSWLGSPEGALYNAGTKKSRNDWRSERMKVMFGDPNFPPPPDFFPRTSPKLIS